MTKNFLFRRISLTNLPHISQKKKKKNERSIRPKCKKKKKQENTTVLSKQQQRTIRAFKCWLHCQLTSFETLLSLAKKHFRSMPCSLPNCKTYKNDIREHLGNFHVFSHHIGPTMFGTKMLVVTDQCIFLDQKKGRDAHPYALSTQQ